MHSSLRVDQWKIALVESGCGHHLVGVVDPELQQKAIDIIILLLAEGVCVVCFDV